VLPVVATFFLMFGFLEDSGYIPRLAIFCDRIFRVMGLNGKASCRWSSVSAATPWRR
jgi:ferrous iron transport protein B